jgi:hypothetical protein
LVLKKLYIQHPLYPCVGKSRICPMTYSMEASEKKAT